MTILKILYFIFISLTFKVSFLYDIQTSSYKDATLRSHSLLEDSQSVKHQQINAFQSFSHLNTCGWILHSLFCSHQGSVWSQEKGFCFFPNKVYIMIVNDSSIFMLICRSLSRKGHFESYEEFSTMKKGLMTSI